MTFAAAAYNLVRMRTLVAMYPQRHGLTAADSSRVPDGSRCRTADPGTVRCHEPDIVHRTAFFSNLLELDAQRAHSERLRGRRRCCQAPHVGIAHHRQASAGTTRMTEADSAAYFIGRPVADLQDPYRAEDSAFGSARLDDQRIERGEFAHCTFANISFKKACVKDTTFLDCAFIGCYFRRAEITSSRFIGCTFVDCNFSHIAIKSCDFKYSSFRGCQLPFSEILHCMPSEPNLREELARSLYLASSELGLSGDARRYRMEEIRAREDSYWAAVVGESSWYREHFDWFARVRVFFLLVLSLLNRWLWGYGQRAWILVRNLAFLAFVVFPLAFYAMRDGLVKKPQSTITPFDFVYFSLENVFPSGIRTGIEAISLEARITAGAESVIGVVALALFASYVFRWSLHR